MFYTGFRTGKNEGLNGLAPMAFAMLGLLPLLLVFSRGLADVAGILIALLFLMHSSLKKDWEWLKDPVIKIALLLWAYLLLVVTPFAPQPAASFAQAGPWIRFILFYAAMTHWLCRYPQELRRIFCFIAAIMVFVSADTLVQYLTGRSLAGHVPMPSRLSGPFTHMVVGIFLAKLIFPVTGHWMHEASRKGDRRMQYASTVFLTLILAFIVLSNERTALITSLVGLLLIAGILFTRREARRPVLIVSGALVVIVAAIFITQPKILWRAELSAREIPTFGQSPYAQLWLASIDLWKQHPLFGVGLMNFRDECPKLIAAGDVTYCDMHSHNPYFQFLSETGFVGLIGLLALVVALTRCILHNRPDTPDGKLLSAFALATLMPTFFPFAATQSFFSNWSSWLAWLSIALAVSMLKAVRYE